MKVNKLYALTGTIAVIAGACISAFGAKTPTTLAMWASAYLVLVVGVAQVCFALALGRAKHNTTLYWAYWLFNGGSVLTIAATIAKYSGVANYMVATVAGAVLIIAGMAVLLRLLSKQPHTRITISAIIIAALLAVSSLVGVVLSGV